jgi:hypothetical protein
MGGKRSGGKTSSGAGTRPERPRTKKGGLRLKDLAAKNARKIRGGLTPVEGESTDDKHRLY